MKRVLSVLLFLLVCLSVFPMLPASAAEERRYLGVWQKGTGANIVTGPLSWQDLLKRGEQLTKQGMRLDDVETLMTPNGRRYVGVWSGGSGTNLIVSPLVEGDFQKKRLEMKAKGLRLVDFEIFRAGNGQLLFLGVWRNGTGAEAMSGGLAFADFVKSGNALINAGLRLDDVEIVGAGPGRQYYGLWHTGSGSNLIVSPLHPIEFGRKAKEFTAKGLRLIDLEIFREGPSYLYVSVWAKGPAQNRLKNLMTFPQLVSFGEQMVKQGYRLADLETFMAGVPDKPTDDGTDQDGGRISFPHPSYVTYHGPRVVVDFTTAIPDPPSITLPSYREGLYMGDLPLDSDGTPIFPDDACGITVLKASRFIWEKDGKVFEEFPFNNVPENDPNPNHHPPQDSVDALFGSNFYLGGIGFTGPIGKCKSNTTPWRFPFPFTQTEPGAPAVEHVRLTIELESGSEIGFLKHEILTPPEDPSESYEVFSNETKKKFEEALKLLEIASNYCGIEGYVIEKCEEFAQEGHPNDCPVRDDYIPKC